MLTVEDRVRGRQAGPTQTSLPPPSREKPPQNHLNYMLNMHPAGYPDGYTAGYPDGYAAGYPDGYAAGYPDS